MTCCPVIYLRHCLRWAAPTDASDSYFGRKVNCCAARSVINNFSSCTPQSLSPLWHRPLSSVSRDCVSVISCSWYNTAKCLPPVCGALLSFCGLSYMADSAGCLHGPLWSLDVQHERNISGPWSSADSLRWADMSARQRSRRMGKKMEPWRHQWPSIQSCSLNRRLSEFGTEKMCKMESNPSFFTLSGKLGHPSEANSFHYPQLTDTTTLYTLTLTVLRTALSAWESLTNSVEALMHWRQRSRQHRAH